MTRRTVSRTGSIGGPYRRKDGSVWYRIRWFDHDGARRTESVTGSKADARRRLDTRLREAEQVRVGLRVPESNAPTLEEVTLRAEREVLPLRQRPRQRLRTLTIMQQWWGELLGKPVNAIEVSDIQAILAQRRASGSAAATCNRALSALSIILRAAVSWGHIQHNVARSANLRQREGRKVPRFLTAEEASRVLAAMDDAWRPFFATAIFTGMRLSELAELRWRDVDLDNRRITVRMSRDGDDPKSKHHRVLAIHRQLVPHLAEVGPQPASHLVFRGRRRRGAAKEDPTADKVVGVRKPLLRGLKAAGIDRHVTIHDLRHTFATLCIEAGVDIRQLQEMLGHSTIAMTARYVHALGSYSASLERIALPDNLEAGGEDHAV